MIIVCSMYVVLIVALQEEAKRKQVELDQVRYNTVNRFSVKTSCLYCFSQRVQELQCLMKSKFASDISDGIKIAFKLPDSSEQLEWRLVACCTNRMVVPAISKFLQSP